MSNIRFSVLMSVYKNDSHEFLQGSLDSILINQTRKPDQLVLVIDGPISQEIGDVIEDFVDRFPDIITILKFAENQGLGYALRAGLSKCKFDIVARMDSDDIAYPDRFEKQILFLQENPVVSVLGTSIQEFNHFPGDIRRYRKLPSTNESILKFAKYRCPVNHPSVVFRKAHVLAVGSYQHFPLFEDYFLWIRLLAKNYVIHNLEDPLLHFRVGNDMIGRRHGMSYVKKEYNLFKAAYSIGFLTKTGFFKLVILRLPLRVMPKRLLSVVYRYFLR